MCSTARPSNDTLPTRRSRLRRFWPTFESKPIWSSPSRVRPPSVMREIACFLIADDGTPTPILRHRRQGLRGTAVQRRARHLSCEVCSPAHTPLIPSRPHLITLIPLHHEQGQRWPRLFGQNVPFLKWSPAVVCLRCLGQCRQIVEVDLIWCFVGKCRVRSSLVVERNVCV